MIGADAYAFSGSTYLAQTNGLVFVAGLDSTLGGDAVAATVGGTVAAVLGIFAFFGELRR
jgi:hypothetical protein